MAKARKLPPGIRQLDSGKYQASVWVIPGRKRRTHTSPLLRECVDWKREQEIAIRRGEWRDPRLAKTVFADWFERWWAARVLEPETIYGQRSTAERHVLPVWRDWSVGSIGVIEVQGWVARMQRDGVGTPTIVKAFGIMRACMGAAAKQDLISKSPCQDITLPTAEKPAPRYFTVAQVERIVAALPEPHSTVALVMAWTGLRWQEVAGLEVDRVNTLRRELAVEQVVTRARRIKGYAKTEAGNRTVPVPEHVLERLAPFWREAAAGEPFRDGAGRRPVDRRLLFRTGGLPLLYPTWWEAWRVMQRRLPDVPRETPHTLRHTAASWWVQGGVPIFDVQKLLGHGDIESTMIYAHLAPGVHRNVREAWSVLLGGDEGRVAR